MDLKATQLKDTFGNLLTIGTSAGTPTTGGLENGNGDNITRLGIGNDSPTSGNILHLTDSDTQIKLEATGGSNSGFVNFDGTSLQLSTNRDNKTGTFSNTGKSNASVLLVGSDGGSHIRFNTASANNTTATERMRITGDGDIEMPLATNAVGRFVDNVGEVGSGNFCLQVANSANDALKPLGFRAEKFVFATGNVGIGATSPDAPLTVHSSTDPEIRFGYSASQDHRIAFDSSKVNIDADPENANASSGVGLRVDGTMGLFVDDSHNVAIGTNAPIEVSSTANWLTLDSASGSSVSGGIVHAIDGSSKAVQYIFGSNVLYDAKSGIGHQFTVNNGTEVMRMKTDGDLLIGTTANVSSTQGGAEFLAGESGGRSILRLSTTNTTANDLIVFFNGNGVVGRIRTESSATSYLTSSDYRLKENVVEMTGALDRIDKLKPSRFNFIADADTTVDGFLAHEVADVVPEAIDGEKDGVDEDGNPEYQSIDHSKLVPLLVGAIKELKAEIEQLKNK